MSGSQATVWEAPAGTIPVVNANGNVLEEVQVATAGQTVFNLASFQYTPGTHSIFVYRKSGTTGGQMLRRAVDYTETSITRITLTAGATVGDLLFFIAIAISQIDGPPVINGVPSGGTTGQILTKASGSDYDMVWQALSALSTLLDADRINVASAATINLTVAGIANTSRNLQITGSVQIDGFQVTHGQLYAVRFAAALTLKNNAAIITQRNADIAVAAGDTCFIRATADNIVEVLGYSEAYAKAKLAGDIALPFSSSGFVGAQYNGGQLAGQRNKIINGKMDFSRRAASFAAIATGAYSLDRFIYVNTSAAVATISQDTASVPATNEFQNALKYIITTADAAIAAGDAALISQRIEGYNVRDLIGRDLTVSFWVRSAKTGTHCVALRNSVNDRSHVKEYTINVANTWEYKTLTVPAGLITAGTWNWTTGLGLEVGFVLAAGATYQTAKDAWQVGNFLATANQVNCLDTIGNIFAITGVQLEVGAQATPFEHRHYTTELSLCERYAPIYAATAAGNDDIALGLTTGASSGVVSYQFNVQPRIAPTGVTLAGLFSLTTGGATSGVSAITISITGSRMVRLNIATSAAPFTINLPVILYAANAAALIIFTGCEL